MKCYYMLLTLEMDMMTQSNLLRQFTIMSKSVTESSEF
jgi:hypothetical protein